jgi:hypothetical protein
MKYKIKAYDAVYPQYMYDNGMNDDDIVERHAKVKIVQSALIAFILIRYYQLIYDYVETEIC